MLHDTIIPVLQKSFYALNFVPGVSDKTEKNKICSSLSTVANKSYLYIYFQKDKEKERK